MPQCGRLSYLTRIQFVLEPQLFVVNEQITTEVLHRGLKVKHGFRVSKYMCMYAKRI